MNQTQAVDEYVSNALRGSNLPYDEDIKWIVREHLVELQKVHWHSRQGQDPR